jgi:protein O-mannosyl-transferase
MKDNPCKSGSHFPFFTTEFLLLLLAVCIFFVYSNSIKGPFVFDDANNIKDNPQIRLTELTLGGIIKAGFESPCPHRPVVNISFALNYYFSRYDVVGYHLVNILIHIITGIILFYFIKVTLGLLNPQDLNLQREKNAPPDPIFIAFFATFIWLVHPLQTQTVSYIVQRMNGMASMFYVLSIFLFAKARCANSKGKKQALFLGSILSGILSLGSKEIAATLPFFIFLYEWYFFQKLNRKWLKRNSIYFLLPLIMIVFAALFYLGGHPIKSILSAYSARDFTLWQRVLTEFRVVVYYISLIIFPHSTRLNLVHDFPVSHSFIDPLTTLFSFIVITGLLVIAVFSAKKERLLSFGILWFLGNLVIESSVIALEIIFEHRVYLPSMFFILIFVSLVYRFVGSKWMGGALLCAVAIIFSVWTFQRNMVWGDDVALWKDGVIKSPHQSRQHYNLGAALARKGELDDAIKSYNTALKIDPDYVKAYYNLGNALARKGDAETAIYNYRKALQLNPDFYKSYYNIARILSNQGETGKAIQNYQKALIINSEMTQALYNLSWIYATSKDKKYRNGIKAVKLAEKLCRLTGYQQPLALDALAAAYAETNNFDKASLTAKKALGLALQVGPKELSQGLKKRFQLYQKGQPYRHSLR